jgi:hypothetical protein
MKVGAPSEFDVAALEPIAGDEIWRLARTEDLRMLALLRRLEMPTAPNMNGATYRLKRLGLSLAIREAYRSEMRLQVSWPRQADGVLCPPCTSSV